ncbi:MotA/TolQ/ExbB proton channel family protein [Myxococcota bacterium]|nr:MotA/TolQ/ExbB proton channel family protein [Myxococcota bacterium]
MSRTLILTGLIGFGFFAAIQTGLLRAALESDRSFLSTVILLVYTGASLQWLLLSWRLSTERDRLARLEAAFSGVNPPVLERAGSGVRVDGENWDEGDLGRHLSSVLAKRETIPGDPETGLLLQALADVIANRHASGHFLSDALLRLGLLGTVVGFILMLAPVAGMESFDPVSARALLQEMSGGMAVALYTTLCGLITSLLLKLQYQVLDSSAQDFLNRLAVVTDVRLASFSSGA